MSTLEAAPPSSRHVYDALYDDVVRMSSNFEPRQTFDGAESISDFQSMLESSEDHKPLCIHKGFLFNQGLAMATCCKPIIYSAAAASVSVFPLEKVIIGTNRQDCVELKPEFPVHLNYVDGMKIAVSIKECFGKMPVAIFTSKTIKLTEVFIKRNLHTFVAHIPESVRGESFTLQVFLYRPKLLKSDLESDGVCHCKWTLFLEDTSRNYYFCCN